jgi:hypothetical protein
MRRGREPRNGLTVTDPTARLTGLMIGKTATTTGEIRGEIREPSLELLGLLLT